MRRSSIVLCILQMCVYTITLRCLYWFDQQSYEQQLLEHESLLSTQQHHKDPGIEEKILNNTAFLIKTFDRHQCVDALLYRIRELYPLLAIYIADDGYEAYIVPLEFQNESLKYIRLPVDSGVGFGRNELIRHADMDSYKYIIMSDDDYFIEDMRLIESMIQRFVAMNKVAMNHVDIIAPYRCEERGGDPNLSTCPVKRNSGELVVHDQTLYVVPNIMTKKNTYHPMCGESELFQQFFFARTSIIRSYGWDDSLKNNDHYDFLLNLKNNGIVAMTCADLKILHTKHSCQVESKRNKEYVELRSKRWFNLLNHVFQKHNLHTLHDENSQSFALSTTSLNSIVYTKGRVMESTTTYMNYAIQHYHDSTSSIHAENKIVYRDPRNTVHSRQHGDCYELITANLVTKGSGLIQRQFYQFLPSCPLLSTAAYHTMYHDGLIQRHPMVWLQNGIAMNTNDILPNIHVVSSRFNLKLYDKGNDIIIFDINRRDTVTTIITNNIIKRMNTYVVCGETYYVASGFIGGCVVDLKRSVDQPALRGIDGIDDLFQDNLQRIQVPIFSNNSLKKVVLPSIETIMKRYQNHINIQSSIVYRDPKDNRIVALIVYKDRMGGDDQQDRMGGDDQQDRMEIDQLSSKRLCILYFRDLNKSI